MVRAVTPIRTVKPVAKGRKQTGSAQAAGAAPKVKGEPARRWRETRHRIQGSRGDIGPS
jgi:hypothetical protein